MVVSNLSDWMVTFAIDLTSVAVEDTVGRSKVVEGYKQSILECGIVPFIPVIEIEFDEELANGVWEEPNDAVTIDADEADIVLNEWVEPKEALVIDVDGSFETDNFWQQPFDAIIMDGCDLTPHGVWSEPTC